MGIVTFENKIDAMVFRVLIASFVAMFGIAVVVTSTILASSHSETVSLVKHQVKEELSQIPFSINRLSVELESVAETVSISKRLGVSIFVTQAGRLVSGSGIDSGGLFSSNYSIKEQLRSGEDIYVGVIVDSSELILTAFTVVSILGLLILGCFGLYRFYFRKVSSGISSPLVDLKNEVGRVASNLPESAKSPLSFEGSMIEECAELADSVEHLREEFSKKVEDLKLVSKSEAQIEMARTMVHDLRSPVQSLKFGIERVQGLGEIERKLFTNVVERIDEMIDHWRQVREGAESKLTKMKLGIGSRLVNLELKDIVEEKRILASERGVNIKLKVSNDVTFAEFNTMEFKRVISNLLDNSLKAGASEIEVSSLRYEAGCRVTVSDNGHGVEEERLKDIFDKGVSYTGSSGLGLFYVWEKVQAWNGLVIFNSKVGEGTVVDLNLSVSELADPIVKQLEVSKERGLLVVDDGSFEIARYRHLFEGKKFKKIRFEQEVQSFGKRIEEELGRDTDFLVDYDFGPKARGTNGIMLIKKYGIQDRSYLVTNNYDSLEILEECKKEGIRLFPKPLLELDGKVQFV